jgi:hypothetical protein
MIGTLPQGAGAAVDELCPNLLPRPPIRFPNPGPRREEQVEVPSLRYSLAGR